MGFRGWMMMSVCSVFGTLAVGAHAQVMQASDITKQPTLYVVPYAHLDTQWRWDFQQTISEYLLKTMRVNFDYIDKYPHYVFNWTGANRYSLMKEYYPDDYARMKKYISEGRWFPAGSSVEEGDVNLPSAESIFRQIFYGNNQDWGHHDIVYGLAGHRGDWREGETDWQAYRLSTPLLAFATTPHNGPLGRSFSLMSVDNPHIRDGRMVFSQLRSRHTSRAPSLCGSVHLPR